MTPQANLHALPVAVYVETLGCRLNEAEAARWAREFAARGHPIAANPDAAGLIVINTCAVTTEAARKSRKLLRRAQRANPHARLVISGCAASLEPQALAALPGVDQLV
ncbi:MAG: hypothetical protein AB7Q97_24830, partial [Gammaproteobacteria bacterium]